MLRLVIVNLFRNPLRTILTLGSVTVALFLFCSLGGVLDTLQASIDAGSRERLAVRNAISLTQILPWSYHDRLAAMPGVKSVAVQNWFGGRDPQDERGFFFQFAVDAPFWPMYAKDIRIVAWSPPQAGVQAPPEQDPHLAAYFAERNACVVGAALMKRKGWRLGQTIHLTGTIFPGTWDFVIRAVYDNAETNNFRNDGMFFRQDYLVQNGTGGQEFADVFKLAIADPSQSANIAKRIDAMFENSDAATLSESEQAFTAGFVSMYGNVPFALRMIGFAVVFTILVIAANTMVMAVRERTSEIAVLKTLGFSDTTVFSMIVAEAAVIALGGGLLGSLLARYAVNGANLGVLPPLVVFWSTILTGIAIAVGIGAVSGLVPAWQAARLRIVDALRRVE